ncbi:hypothetical protein TSACC_2169 [Terrimicrobium sacchariphilum]|uniref:Uncharacterized protein n=1 Tax=Terrimicrobium sacchariphilum TaxID=690879 RepID=A0A146G1S1_TERSA|nr:hypothetical protein TSACC_2169 [Terrimicrobium sacchariphilum]
MGFKKPTWTHKPRRLRWHMTSKVTAYPEDCQK